MKHPEMRFAFQKLEVTSVRWILLIILLFREAVENLYIFKFRQTNDEKQKMQLNGITSINREIPSGGFNLLNVIYIYVYTTIQKFGIT